MKKYKVTKELIDSFEKWKNENNLDISKPFQFVSEKDVGLLLLDKDISDWWLEYINSSSETNNCLIAIIQWLNGEDVFEFEEPHEFVVRNIHLDDKGAYAHIGRFVQNGIEVIGTCQFHNSTPDIKFNTREEAEKYCVPGYEVVEIDGDGNEVK